MYRKNKTTKKQLTFWIQNKWTGLQYSFTMIIDMALLVAFSKFDPCPFSTVKKKKKGPIKKDLLRLAKNVSAH